MSKITSRNLYHPRNIYQYKSNFSDMAINFPEFRSICKQDVAGKLTINFRDDESLRILTKTLLKKDFDLDVNIPPLYLVPTMSLRLNYILWIEDILTLSSPVDGSEIHGIDIGTGASCVYMLLGGRKNNWNMVGTDIDPESIKFAQDNITNNKLDNLLKAILTTNEAPLFSFLSESDRQYDFCMCNPPFFSTLDELAPKKKNRLASRPAPGNAFTGKPSEISTKGGEAEFVSRMIKESAELKQRVRVYTTMVGHKKTLPPLIELIKSIGATSISQSEFFQGHTTRWGLAWTFVEGMDLMQIGNSTLRIKKHPKKSKKDKPIIHSIPKSGSIPTFQEFTSKITSLFDELEFYYTETLKKYDYHCIDVNVYKTTWLHQRRKNREEKRIQNNIQVPINTQLSDNNGANEDGKRHAEDDAGCSVAKKIKLCPNEATIVSFNLILEDSQSNGYILTMILTDPTGRKELLHQILTYIKNNVK